CLKLEYDQMISNKNLELLSDEATLDLSGLFISTVFTAVQKNLIHNNKVNQYFIIETIGLLDNSLQWWAAHKNILSRLAGLVCKYFTILATSVPYEHLFLQCENIMTKKRTWLTPQIF
ncbi:1005_t:CDS:1, partial [Scutellospora calospora]